MERVVRGGPDGDVRYRVVVAGGSAFLERPDGAAGGSSPEPDLTIASDWITAAEIAQGTLSAQAALMTGRLRVRGNLARLAAWAGDLPGLDAVPASVRRRTTY